MHLHLIIELAVLGSPFIAAFAALAWRNHQRKINQDRIDRVMSGTAEATACLIATDKPETPLSGSK
jgi:hypothetical protein